MIISYQWLLTFLQEPLPVSDLSNMLTSIGLEVEAVETTEAITGSLEGLVIGVILTCEKHPNADKLKITTVNIGTDAPLKIVCGASNVAIGQRVVVAPVGTTVFPTEGQPFEIKKAKIRGEESEGMICAEDEIGLGASHAGIIILPENAPIGLLAKTFFNIPEPDYAIHIGLTPNRSDAMSHIGVARDVCAYLSHHRAKKHQVQMPKLELPPNKGSFHINVNVDAAEACPRYTGLCLTNVKVGASPDWLQQKLKTIGVRSINNVVDITNYVLHEFGQPLHAFDADKIKGKTVNVRFPDEGSDFLSLDEKVRKLKSHDLMICDEEEGMCIAGVFGGLHSGVSETTTNIFLESAYFDPTFIRRTSMHHGLRTDAATHFEKGVDINNLIPALMRAAMLICDIAGAEIASEVIDVYPKQLEPKQVTIRYEYMSKLSGKSYSSEAIKNILLSLDFQILKETEESLTLLVPTNKTDITQPADIVEEVLRIDGLDNIAIPERLNISLKPTKPNERDIYEKLAETLCGVGFQEIITNSIVNSKYYPENNDLVQMLNSLSSELDVMRPSLLESGLEVIQYNCNRKNTDLRLFEFGKTYKKQNDRYIEEQQIALWISGNAVSAHWDQKAKPANLAYLKGVLQSLVNRSGIGNVTVTYEQERVVYKHRNQTLCTAFAVPSKRLGEFDIKQEVYFANINAKVWIKAATENKIRYTEVPKYPVVERDLAIVLNKEITYQQVKQTTEQLKIESLTGFDLFDVFESEKLGADKKSYALSYTFQLLDRTLTDAEIDLAMQQLMSSYRSTLQAQIRE
ncbi:MAG TPA: phenylalanine--tRNA ligase subunit beta [Flavipsychrobacter sp.]|nr:phenylalanine--tRNA ligase subunit beta [Flavipsychrobacter sp.]